MMPPSALVDSEHPWPGLVPFDEDAHDFFYGRADAVDDLIRLIECDVGVTLFGRSGLGKTSLLNAGISPQLRERGFLPIPIRLSYHRDGDAQIGQSTSGNEGEHGRMPAPNVVCQVAQCFFEAAVKAGLDYPPLGQTDDMWMYLHRRDFVAAAAEHASVPVFIFDQFEELFTRGMADPSRQEECVELLDLLAALIQGRVPADLRERIKDDPEVLATYRLDEPQYRIVIALREDYLPYLEELSARAPMFNRSRLRLMPMSRKEALKAVVGPGAKVVDDQVAEMIVTLLSGEEAKKHAAEVDPSILSLFCRELNDRRLAEGDDAIDATLVSGQRDVILETFYERCFVGVSDRVRDLVEQELITDAGVRVELSLDNASRAAGGDKAAFELLAERRLLRLEERQGSRRIELVHDVLAEPVRRSRERRTQERVADEAAVEQKEFYRRRFNLMIRFLILALAGLLLAGIVAWIYYRSSQTSAAQAQAMSCTVSLMPNERGLGDGDVDGPRGTGALKLAAGDVDAEKCGRALPSVLQQQLKKSRPEVIRWAIGLSTLNNEEGVQSKIDRIEAAIALEGRKQDPQKNDKLTSEGKLVEAELWKKAGKVDQAAAAIATAAAFHVSGGLANGRDGSLRLADLLMREGQLRMDLGQFRQARAKVGEAFALRRRTITAAAAGGSRLSKADRFKIAEGYASLGRIALMEQAAARRGAFARVLTDEALTHPLTKTGYTFYDRCRSRERGGGGEGLRKTDADAQAIATFCFSHRFKTLYPLNSELARSSVSLLFGRTTFDLNALADTERKNYFELLQFMAAYYRREFLAKPTDAKSLKFARTYSRWVVKAQRDVLANDFTVSSRDALAQSLNFLSEFYQLTDSNDEALSVSSAACFLNSRKPETYSIWGTLYLLMDRKDDARRMYARAAHRSSPSQVRKMLQMQASELAKVGRVTSGAIEAVTRDLDALAGDQTLAGQCDDGIKINASKSNEGGIVLVQQPS